MVSLGNGDALRVRDFYEGTFIYGGTGSGKSSGPGRAARQAALRLGWGGLVLCAKPDEADCWAQDIHEAGRSAHFIRIGPGSEWRINFLDYECHRPDGAGRETFNLVALMEVMMEASAQAIGPVATGDGNPFFPLARRELSANAVEPLVAANGRLRLDELMRMVTSAPTSPEEACNEAWRERSYCYDVLWRSYAEPVGRPLGENELRAAADYWFGTFARLDGKTRSNIVATLTSAISPFLRGVLHDSFCRNTTLIPEMTHEGAIIVWDFPVKTWGAASIVASHMMKYLWQKAAERRAVCATTRPVFLFADECQFFTSEYDAEFQSTARSARAATIYITQNLPTLYARLRGRDPRHTADSLMGNFQTKIFCGNTDPTTNNYAADLIGKSIQRRNSRNWGQNNSAQENQGYSSNWGTQRGTNKGTSWGSNSGSSFGSTSGQNGQSSSNISFSSGSSKGGSKGTSSSVSSGGGESWGESQSQGYSDGAGWSEQMDYTVQPATFAYGLRKGGQADGFLVDAVVVQGGRNFKATGSHWLVCTFKQ